MGTLYAVVVDFVAGSADVNGGARFAGGWSA